jgi:PAS domain-containing protein
VSDVLNIISSLVALVGFAAAAAMSVVLAVRLGKKRSPIVYVSAALAFALLALVSLSNLLEYAGVTTALDTVEDNAELLFFPLLILCAFGIEAQALIDERARAARVLQQQNDMLMSIVDTTPVGIMIVTPNGQIIFANEPARNMLGVYEELPTGVLRHAKWSMTDVDGRPAALNEMVGIERITNARRVLRFPDGTKQQFIFSATPMNDATESLGGAVVALEAIG